jgi:glyoxalase family protein
VLAEGPAPRGAGQVLAFRDPDGLALELVAHPAVTGWPAARGGQIPARQAIRGLYGVTLWVAECALTETFLTAALGLRLLDQDRIGGLRCYGFDGEGPGVAADEEPAEEGTCLVLPPWLEQRRPHLERILPPLRLPDTPPPTSTA